MPNTFVVDDETIGRIATEIAKRLGRGQTSAPAPADAATPSQSDPWDDAWPDAPGTTQTPAPAATAPPAPAPAATVPPQTGTVTINTPKGPQRWTLNASNAPACLCGNPAAHIQGFTNGKPWKRWGCALGASSDNWRNKCDFSEWA